MAGKAGGLALLLKPRSLKVTTSLGDQFSMTPWAQIPNKRIRPQDLLFRTLM
jgi:hypothetical protein